jgi:hypothetical protein
MAEPALLPLPYGTKPIRDISQGPGGEVKFLYHIPPTVGILKLLKNIDLDDAPLTAAARSR